MVRTHFNSLRQRQKQNQDLTTITDDVKFVIQFVCDSVPRPAPVLLEMGMVLLRDYIAFNVTKLSTQLAMTRRNAIIPSLHRDGWKDADIVQQIAPFVGENEVKNWSVLEYPADSDIRRLIMNNQVAIATQANMTEDDRQDVAEHPEAVSFPLVSIEYERDNVTTQCVDLKPLERAVKMEIVKFDDMSFRAPDAK